MARKAPRAKALKPYQNLNSDNTRARATSPPASRAGSSSEGRRAKAEKVLLLQEGRAGVRLDPLNSLGESDGNCALRQTYPDGHKARLQGICPSNRLSRDRSDLDRKSTRLNSS